MTARLLRFAHGVFLSTPRGASPTLRWAQTSDGLVPVLRQSVPYLHGPHFAVHFAPAPWWPAIYCLTVLQGAIWVLARLGCLRT